MPRNLSSLYVECIHIDVYGDLSSYARAHTHALVCAHKTAGSLRSIGNLGALMDRWNQMTAAPGKRLITCGWFGAGPSRWEDWDTDGRTEDVLCACLLMLACAWWGHLRQVDIYSAMGPWTEVGKVSQDM